MNFDFRPAQTPALIIDRFSLEYNLALMQAACDAAKVRLRAHGKMHKCSTFGRLQVAHGAVGLCCQTAGEAEAFARDGIGDLLVSAPLPHWGPPRLAALVCETGATIAAVCDSAAQIDRLSTAAVDARITLGCLIDVDIGMHRAGCGPEAAPALARRAADAPGLRYDGVQAYFGHLQHLAEGRAEANAAATATLAATVAALTDAGLAPPVVTGGGTGTYALDLAGGVFTELQCGSYALMDGEYQDCRGPDGEWPFRQALYIASTVVSANHATHVTIDVGLKATSFDVPPRIVAGAAPGSTWRSMGDEHGAVIPPPGAGVPEEGMTVWLQPGHCDPTINLYDAFVVVAEDGSSEVWAVDGRRVN